MNVRHCACVVAVGLFMALPAQDGRAAILGTAEYDPAAPFMTGTTAPMQPVPGIGNQVLLNSFGPSMTDGIGGSYTVTGSVTGMSGAIEFLDPFLVQPTLSGIFSTVQYAAGAWDFVMSEVGGDLYVLELRGASLAADGTTGIAPANVDAQLFQAKAVSSGVVPLPAAGILMLGALGAVTGLRVRRRRIPG